MQKDNTQEDAEKIVISNDSEKSTEQGHGETPMDSHVADAPQNDSTEQAKTSTDNTVLDYSFQTVGEEGDILTSSSFSGGKDNLEQTAKEGETKSPYNDGDDTDEEEGDEDEDPLSEDERKKELEKARETLEGPITESETFDELGMVVKVKALSGTFPKGTYPEITLIQGTEKENVEQQIIDDPDTDVSADAEMITFDIKFIYTLSNGSGVEVQPKDNTVQVTFEYKENEELQQAEESPEQDIQIIHIKDKDEDGEKVAEGEEKIETIDINEQKSAKVENGLVIDAESFSYYTIVVQIREEASESDPTQTWQYGEDYFTINIARPSGLSSTDYPIEGFTIMDRNLGASISGTTCNTTNATGACGYLYQWGNNYGFPISANASSILTGVGLTWDDSYNNNGYVSKKFINGSSFAYDVWSDSSHHDGVWGGANDVNYASTKNSNGLYWDDGGDRTLRQGPCPEGWHVPSAGEWSMLLDYWYYTNYTEHPSVSNNLYYFSDQTKRQAFMDYFYIPFAGRRSHSNASLNLQGSYGYYWSSSPYLASSNYARALYLLSSNVYAHNYYYRAYGFSVRCFKDSYVASPESSNLVDTQAWVEGKDFETITIWDPANPGSGFTIMDRNLGATTTGYGASASTASYGFKYQWGNNYGFVDGCWTNGCTDSVTSGSVAVSATSGAIWNDVYNNHGYFGNTFIKSSSSSWGYDYWADNTRHNNLRGGGSDVGGINRGANQTNPTERQGPCPVGYHVPSMGEWGLLIKYWADTKGDGVNKNATYSDSSEGLYNLTSNYDKFQQKFNLPFAGRRYYSSASLGYQGSYGYYWSSSPYSAGSDDARNLYLDSSNVSANDYSSRALGRSVRCFKDSYVAPKTYTLTFDSQGGTEVATGTTPENDTRSRPENPTKTDYTFVDWFLSGTNTLFDFTTPATGNLIVYAKWCGAGQTYYPEIGACATRDSNNIVYYWYDGSNDVISIMSGDTILTMMDKNLGATSNDITSTESYGYHYQWGNNYGFEQGCNGNGSSCNDDITNSHSVSGQTGYENFWPGHPYSNPTFLMGNSDYWKNNLHYDNLWGGSGDSTSNNRGGIDNGDTRQGPCPAGYHVPSMREWETVLQYFAGKVGQSLTVNGDFHYFSNSTNRQKFQDVFLLPRAGYRDNSIASLNVQGSFGYYWSSSPFSASSNYARYLRLDSSRVRADNSFYNRAFGFSVRCFKDSYVAPSTYTLELDANGGTLLGADSEGKLEQKVAAGKKAQQPVAPTKDGVNFQGWVYSNDEATAFDFSTDTVNSDIQLKAKWATQYTITFDATTNGASSTTQTSITETEGTVVNLPTCTETKAGGYECIGWNTISGAHAGLPSITLDGDKTVYAIFSGSITATFKPNGNQLNNGDADVPVSCTLYNKETICQITTPTISNSTTPTVVGYTTSETAVDNASIGSNSPLNISGGEEYYAHTMKAGYSVTLSYSNGNGVSSISPTSQTCYVATGYNGASQIGCSKSAPTVNCSNGYSNLQWNTSLSTAVLSDTTYTATCSDSEKPVCSVTTQPTRTSMSLVEGYTQGTVTFTCTDNVGVSTSNLSADNITYDSNVVTLSNFTAGGTSTSKTFTFTYTSNAQGSTTFALKAGAVSDAAGNSNVVTDVSNTVTVDTTPPAISFTNNVKQGPSTIDDVTVDWGDATVKKWKYSDTNSCPTSYSSYDKTDSDSMNQSDETNNGKYICLYAEDALGNATQLASAYPINIDITSPTCIISGNPENWTNQSVTLTVTMADTNVKSDGYSWDGETYSSTQTYVAESNGTYIAYVKDAAGNTGSCSVSVSMIDKVLPNITINNPDTTPAQSKTITATTDKGTLYMAITGANVCDDSLDFVAYESITFSSESDNGKYVCYKAVDEAGNITYEISNPISGIKESSKGSNYSGGGGRRTPAKTDTHGSAETGDKIDNVVDVDTGDMVGDNKSEEENSQDKDESQTSFTQEQIDAYTWANENGITTKSTIESAKLNTEITREQLAKMMVVYMSKVLGKQPVINKTAKYRDVSEKSRGKEMANYIQLAYQYQIMGINYKGEPIRYFNPEGRVTRAEFATVLSRVLYGSKYNKKGVKYYEKHIQALNQAGVLNNTNPELIEKRGYVMLMLMRSAK